MPRNRAGVQALVVLVVLVALGIARADAEVTTDFAVGWEIEVAGDHDFFEVTLPLEVYESSIHEGLWDVAVLNGEGASVPRFIYPTEIVERTASRSHELPVLPVWVDPLASPPGLTLKITRSRRNEIIELGTVEPVATLEQGRRFYSYILDARALEDAPEKLSLEWEPLAETFLGSVTIEASNDLNSWRPVGEGAVAALGQGAERLVRGEVRLAAERFWFYQLRFRGVPESWRLKEAFAITSARWSQEIERRELTLTPRSAEDGTYRFDAGGHLFVDAVQVRLATENSLARARVYSGNREENVRHLRHDGVVYHLRNAGNAAISDPVSIGPVRARYWQVVLEGTAPGEQVELRVAWRPDNLGFVAQGSGPYRLVAGSERQKELGFPLHKRYDDPAVRAFWLGENRSGSAVAGASPGPRTVLGGESALEATAEPLPWKRWALWSVLVAAVLLVAFMALKLGRELNVSG